MRKKTHVTRVFKKYGEKKETVVYRLVIPDAVGEIAVEICREMASNAILRSGDGKGMQALVMGEKDIAEYSCLLAEALWKEMESRKMLIDVPDPFVTKAVKTSEDDK